MESCETVVEISKTGDNESVTLLFNSRKAAQEVAWMLRGEWDGCNGVSFDLLDEEAIITAAALQETGWCKPGDSYRISTNICFISQEAGEALQKNLARYF